MFSFRLVMHRAAIVRSCECQPEFAKIKLPFYILLVSFFFLLSLVGMIFICVCV